MPWVIINILSSGSVHNMDYIHPVGVYYDGGRKILWSKKLHQEASDVSGKRDILDLFQWE